MPFIRLLACFVFSLGSLEPFLCFLCLSLCVLLPISVLLSLHKQTLKSLHIIFALRGGAFNDLRFSQTHTRLHEHSIFDKSPRWRDKKCIRTCIPLLGTVQLHTDEVSNIRIMWISVKFPHEIQKSNWIIASS